MLARDRSPRVVQLPADLAAPITDERFAKWTGFVSAVRKQQDKSKHEGRSMSVLAALKAIRQQREAGRKQEHKIVRTAKHKDPGSSPSEGGKASLFDSFVEPRVPRIVHSTSCVAACIVMPPCRLHSRVTKAAANIPPICINCPWLQRLARLTSSSTGSGAHCLPALRRELDQVQGSPPRAPTARAHAS